MSQTIQFDSVVRTLSPAGRIGDHHRSTERELAVRGCMTRHQAGRQPTSAHDHADAGPDNRPGRVGTPDRSSVTCSAMASGTPPADWWTALPARQVSHLPGLDAELLHVGLDPSPVAAPVVVRYRVPVHGGFTDLLAAVLDELDRAAVRLFPRWLPGAERLDGAGTLGTAAVRALASRAAARSAHFGPFLADLAERALRGENRPRRPRFPAEVRAAGLARVIAAAYERDGCVLLVGLTDELTADGESALVAVAEWLVRHGRFTVWLAGRPLRTVDRIRSVAVPLPSSLTELAEPTGRVPDSIREPPPMLTSPPMLTFPPLSGVPRGDSAPSRPWSWH